VPTVEVVVNICLRNVFVGIHKISHAIVAGIVSHKNAEFLNNLVSGCHIRYEAAQ